MSPLRSHKSAPPCLRRCPACPARVCRRSRFRSSATIARRGPSCPKWNTSQSCISITMPSSETDTRELTGCTVTLLSRRRTIRCCCFFLFATVVTLTSSAIFAYSFYFATKETRKDPPLLAFDLFRVMIKVRGWRLEVTSSGQSGVFATLASRPARTARQ